MGRDNLPDAIFFGGDITAFGAMWAMVNEGIAIPEDIKIVGFDNDVCYNKDMNIPALTTLDQPLHDMGVCAVDMLIKAIESPSMPKMTQTFLPELIIRHSTVSET